MCEKVLKGDQNYWILKLWSSELSMKLKGLNRHILRISKMALEETTGIRILTDSG